MAIQVHDAEELKRLIQVLALELVDANIAFKMHMNLIAAYEGESRAAMLEGWTFWALTIQGHLDSAVFRLCRIYDQDDRNLGMRGLFDTIRANQHFFSRARFAERMQGRDHAEELIANFEPIDAAQLAADINYVTRTTNPVVDRLIRVRHNYYSHRNATDVVDDLAIHETYPHMRHEVGDLLEDGLDIMNRYSMLFDRNSWSPQIMGSSDYHFVLRAARERFERVRAERGM
jgi:hypothetical protein